VKAANWLNHLEFDWQSPVWRHVFGELPHDHQLVRYDERGNGLSDWEVDDISFEAFVRDLETVVDAVGLERFALLGISQGCSVSIAYAVRHPERVSQLVLYGGYARGWAMRGPKDKEQGNAVVELIRQSWGQDNPAFRQMFTSQMIPGARFVPLESANHLLIESEPGWPRFLAEVRGFLS
jgi:pimeloyl-ACP methyl ester carboxylesterase